MAMANTLDVRSEIQRALEDFTRGAIDFQTLLSALDETFHRNSGGRLVALDLIDQLDPVGALQRGFFRVLKERIEDNLATGAAIPITAPPPETRVGDAVVQTDLGFEEPSVARRRIGADVETQRAAASPELAPHTESAATEPIAEPPSMPPPTSDGPTVPLERPGAAATATVPPPPPEPPAPEARVKAEPAPAVAETRAEPAPARVRAAAPPPARPAAAARDHPFVTERRELAAPRPNPLAWIAGVIIIGLLIALILLGPLREYVPQMKALVTRVQQDIPALFEPHRAPPAPVVTAPEATPPPPAEPTQTPAAAPTDTAAGEPSPATTAMQSAPASTPPAVTQPAATPPATPPAPSSAEAHAAPAAVAPAPEPAATAAPSAAAPASSPSKTAPSASAAEAQAETTPAAAGPGRFTFAARAYSVREDAGMVALRIERRDGSSGAASVNWSTKPGTATPGEDYADFGTRTETFADGEKTRVIYVPIASDDVAEDRENFYVQLGEPAGGAALGATPSAMVTIVDDDP